MTEMNIEEKLKMEEDKKKKKFIVTSVVMTSIVFSIFLTLIVGYVLLTDERVITYFPKTTYSVDTESFLEKVTEEKDALYQERTLRAKVRRFYHAFFVKNADAFEYATKFLERNSKGPANNMFNAFLNDKDKYKEMLLSGERWDFYPVSSDESYRQRRIDEDDPSQGWVVKIDGILVKRRNGRESVYYSTLNLHLVYEDAKLSKSLSGVYYNGFKFEYIKDPISGERESLFNIWAL